MVAIAEPDPPHSADNSTQNHAADGDESHTDQQQPFDPLVLTLAQLREYLQDYLEARKDQIGTTVRRLVIIAAAAVVAIVIALTVLVESVVLVLSGVAEMVSARWSNHPGWGEIFIGGDLILLGGIVAIVVAVLWVRSARKRIVSKYERLHEEQRNRFGRDVSQRP